MIIQGDNLIVNGNTVSGDNFSKLDDYIWGTSDGTSSVVKIVNPLVTTYTTSLAESVTKSTLAIKTHSTDSTLTTFGALSGGDGYIQRSNGPGTGSYNLSLNPFGGAVKMPNQPAFMAYNSLGHQTSSTAEIMAFTNTLTNVGNCYNTTTYRFTAPVTGRYRFSKSYMTYSGNHERSQFRKNGSGVGDQCYVDVTSNGSQAYSRGCYEIIIDLAAGDYIEVWRNVQNETGTAVHVSYRHFVGELIG